MDNYWWCSILFRIVLPLVIIIAIFVRPTLTTYMYTIMGCYMPFFSVPTVKTMAGSTGTYMKMLLIMCILTTVLVFSFYFGIYFPRESGDELKPCSTIEIIIRTLGVVEIKDLTFKDALPWCLPEPMMLVTSLTLYFTFRKLCQDTDVTRATAAMEDTEMIREIQRKKLLSMMLHFGKYLLVFMFCLTAVLVASVWGSVYYLVFLSVTTYWACNRTLGKVFARILVLLIPIMFLNISIVFLYQLQYFQDNEVIDPTSLWGRLLNLADIKTYKDCNDPRLFKFHTLSSQAYAIPGCLFFLYYLTVLISREILQAEDGLTPLFLTCCQGKRLSVPAKWEKALTMVQDQIEDQKLAGTSFLETDRFQIAIEQILQIIINISYLTANFVMMLWAVMYVSWKTIVLLVWANLIWLLPFRKRVMLSSSPFLVAWVWFLLVLSYLYLMNLTPEELPTTVWIFDLSVGIDLDSKVKWVHTLTKSMFGVILFVTMRQFWAERALRKQRRKLEEAVGLSGVEEGKSFDDDKPTTSVTFLDRFKSAFMGFFAVWWIWVVIVTMIWMDFWTTSNLFRIAFVGLAILCIMAFQLCPFVYWKKFLRVFWWIVIVYAMLNLFVVYMYQVKLTRKLIHMCISEENFKIYGYHVLDDKKWRSIILVNPIFFQIAVVIQQNYFQDKFDNLTSPIPRNASAGDLTGAAEEESKWRKVQAIYTNAKHVVFEILEVHLRKIALLVGWYMCIFDMCALYFPFVLLFAACCAFGRRFTNASLYLVSFLVQILIVLRLIYMNQYMNHDSWNYVGHYTRNGKLYNKTLNSAEWLGFHKSRLGKNYADFWQLSWNFLFVFIVTVMRVVSIRMENYRVAENAPSIYRKVLFPEITYENCHDSTRAMLKFLVNFGFYKFGCEITLVFASVLMGLRMDAVAIMMSLWLLVMFPLNRRWMRILWLPMLILVIVAIPVQYLVTLGFWPSYWNKSDTRFWNSNDFLLRVQQFSHLMNLAHPPKKEKLSLDFWFLLLTSLQWRSFGRERRLRGQYCAAGSNDDVSNLIDDKDVKNPVPDFFTYTRSYLDVFKRIFFTLWFYVSLLCTFLAGIMRPGIYSFGYILGAFVFVWEGTDMFLRPPRSILWRWNLLIGYTVVVMITRTIGQVFGCILKYETHIHMNCAMLRLFAIGCVDKFDMTGGVPNLSVTASCEVDYDALGLGFDCLCFFFLIFQRRAFQSYHFFHVVNETKARTILADRGADLLEDTKQKKRQSLDAEDALIRNNIEKKMTQIRARHQNVQGNVYLRRKKNHRHMLKSGDYYLFDDASLSNDIHLLPVKIEEDDNEFDPYDPMSLTEYFGLIHSTNDIRSVLAERSLRRRQKSALQKGKKPEVVKKAITTTSAQPGSSSSDPDPPIKLQKGRKILDIIIFIWGIFESSIVSLTGLINRRTKDFRHVLTKMNRDMRILKEKTTYAQGIRLGSNKIWHPAESFKVLLSADKSQIFDRHAIQYSVYAKLLRATWYLLLSHSEWFCYFLIILNQVIEAHFISLPLVILIFCWGALTVPKPTKTFWVVIFGYLLVMLFIKSFFLLDLAPWNVAENDLPFNLFFPPEAIGVTDLNDLTFDVVMLTVFFLNRIVLQMLGIWKPINYRSASLISDGDYILTDGKLVPLAKDGARKGQGSFEAKTINVSMGDYFPKSIGHGITKYAEGFMLFTQQLIFSSSTHIPVDVYTPMFLCDLFNLFLIIFFYGNFMSDENDKGLIGFIEDNRVRLSFIISMLVLILLMIIDRAIYLRKNRFMKIVYHFFQVIVWHIWFFVLHPLFTHSLFKEALVVQVFYAFKCLYFLFSAYQIRNGYPRLVSHHFLLNGTSVFNRFGYKLYMVIPYIFELRTLLDWICTDSCLGVNDWFKMEEITENIFDQKCEQDIEEKWFQPSGKPKSHTKKYLLGGFLYVLLILTVIFPFLIFSLGSAVGVTTHPAKIKLELYMGTSEPIFQSYASEKNLNPLTEADYRNLTRTFNNIDQSELIFEDFKPEDIIVFTWSPHSLTKWKVSPGSFSELMEDLWSNDTFAFRLEIHYVHKGHGGQKEERTFGQTTYLPPLPNVQRDVLIKMLEASESLDEPVWMPLVFPKFLMISQESMPRTLSLMEEATSDVNYSSINQDQDDEDDDEDLEASPKLFRNLLLSLRHNEDGDMWWHVTEECTLDDDNYFYYLKDLVHNTCDELVIYTFNEKVFSNTMNYLTQSGILGLYLLYFMVVIGIIRSCRIEIGEIWIEDLPNSDEVFRKCLEVYVAREMENYELEEELFAELIFIMRSRETLIKMTRFKDSAYNPPIPDSGVKK